MLNEIKDKAIVLSAKDYGESDKLVTLFTLDSGKMTVKMRGVKKPKAKLAFAALPFCFAEFIIAKGKGLDSVINVNSIDNFFNITTDLNKYYGACVIVEAISILSRPDEKNPNLFVCALSALKTLCYTDQNVMKIVAKFLIDVMDISGYKINTNECAVCGKQTKSNLFSFEQGSFICSKHGGDDLVLVSENAAERIREIDGSSYEEIGEEVQGVKNAIKLLSFYFSDKTGAELNTIKVFL